MQKINKLMFDEAVRLFGAERIIKAEAKLRYGRDINLDFPETLSDKICFLEHRVRNPLTTRCTDKFEVRSYLQEKGLGDILVPLIGVYDKTEEIPYKELPEKFVLKATFGCKMNIICKDKKQLDWKKACSTTNDWLKHGFSREQLEPHYLGIQRRLICEKYLESNNGMLDYKVHCLNGKAVFILVCSNRDSNLQKNLYSNSWEIIDGLNTKWKNEKSIPCPMQLKKMITMAEILSEDFPFVRVDFYQIGEKVYFSELTFTPDRGYMASFTDQFNREMGSKLNLIVKEANAFYITSERKIK